VNPHAGEGNGFTCSCDAYKFTLMGGGEPKARDHLISFGNQIFDGELEVGKGTAQRRYKALLVGCIEFIKNLITDGQVVLVPDFFPQSADNGFVLLR